MMKRRLGRTDLFASALGLDARILGWQAGPEAASRLLDTYAATGGNLLQFYATAQTTAGCPLGETPATEAATTATTVGRWLVRTGRPRADCVLALRLQLSPALVARGGFALTAELQRTCEQYLHRLGVEHLDLLTLDWAGALAAEEALDAVATLQRAGLIRHFGCGRFPAWRTMEWIGHATRRGLGRPEIVQVDVPCVDALGLWTEVRDLARAQRLGVLMQAPVRELPAAAPSGTGPLRTSPAGLATARHLVTLARQLGAAPRAVALARTLADPAVTAVLVQPRSPADVVTLAAATRLELPTPPAPPTAAFRPVDVPPPRAPAPALAPATLQLQPALH